jgi:DNA-binding FadR family transcriptional regulator
MQVLMDVHTRRMSTIKLDDEAKQEILEQHEELIEAMEKKDSDLAFERMRSHIIRVHEIHTEIEERSRSGRI